VRPIHPLGLGLLVLIALPLVLPPFETLQVSYGLVFGIAALGTPDQIRRNEQVAMTLLGTHGNAEEGR
jgi:hypothetical protein